MIEIVLRYYISLHQNNWADHIEFIQIIINITSSRIMNHSFFKLLYGFNPSHVFDLIAGRSIMNDWTTRQEMLRKDATNTITLIQQEMIKYNNKKRKPISFIIEDKMFLRLTSFLSKSEYILSSMMKPKISQQKTNPFEILKIMGKNVYKLKLSITWKIWSIISIVYLNPTSIEENSFERTASPPPSIIQATDDPKAEWEIKTIVKKCMIKRDRRHEAKTEYLIRWKNFKSKYDKWKDMKKLESYRELMKEYESAVGNTAWTPPISWIRNATENEVSSSH